jgi:hypothetical protein
MRVGAFLVAASLSAGMICIAATVAATAQPAASSARPHRADSCISPEFIDGISADDTHTAYLSVGPSDMYRLDMMGPCLNLDWPMTPKRLVDKMGSHGDICDAHDMVLIVGGHQRCYVSSMHKMTPAEIDAWRHKGKH